jgi:hypothetical protein
MQAARPEHIASVGTLVWAAYSDGLRAWEGRGEISTDEAGRSAAAAAPNADGALPAGGSGGAAARSADAAGCRAARVGEAARRALALLQAAADHAAAALGLSRDATGRALVAMGSVHRAAARVDAAAAACVAARAAAAPCAQVAAAPARARWGPWRLQRGGRRARGVGPRATRPEPCSANLGLWQLQQQQRFW